jgi:hypothetical protein
MQNDDIHASHIESEQYSYEEIEGVISNKDDTSTLCFTFRACFIGLLLVLVRSIFHTYFLFRTLPYILASIHFYLAAYPLGRFLAFVLPRRIFTRWNLSLNPGPFTSKEHMLIELMTLSTDAGSGIGLLAIRRFTVTRKLLHPVVTIIYLISIQGVGFGLAGRTYSLRFFFFNSLFST